MDRRCRRTTTWGAGPPPAGRRRAFACRSSHWRPCRRPRCTCHPRSARRRPARPQSGQAHRFEPRCGEPRRRMRPEQKAGEQDAEALPSDRPSLHDAVHSSTVCFGGGCARAALAIHDAPGSASPATLLHRVWPPTVGWTLTKPPVHKGRYSVGIICPINQVSYLRAWRREPLRCRWRRPLQGQLYLCHASLRLRWCPPLRTTGARMPTAATAAPVRSP